MNNHSKRRLGISLPELMSDKNFAPRNLFKAEARQPEITLDDIVPGNENPRQVFHPDKLDELALSIREKGVVQPIVLRKNPDREPSYLIVAGERRWAAARKAGCKKIPAVVLKVDHKQAMEIALIENVQRDDLSPIEEGNAYARLIDEFDYSQEEIATFVGKSRSYVANLIRLRKLPRDVQTMINNHEISAGQARPLIGNPDAVQLARDIVENQINAREAEKLAPNRREKPNGNTGSHHSESLRTGEGSPSSLAQQLALELGACLGARVGVSTKKHGGGSITIRYKNARHLQDIIAAIRKG